MQKTCKNCSASFEITIRDKEFYKKIAVLEPSFCVDCRQQRRSAWRNERHFFRRKCDATGKSIISMYPPDSPFKVYDQSFWWSDKWDAKSYGRDFDFSRPFFEQFRELQLEVPRLSLVNKQSENSEYTNHSGKNKNCYLSAITFESEDVYYSDWIVSSRDLFDSSYITKGSELCYETYYAEKSFQCFFSEFIKRCNNLWFCYDCINSRNSFMSSNLRNAEYYFYNTKYTKEEFKEKMKSIFPLSHSELESLKKEYQRMKREKFLHPALYHVNTENSTGDILFNTKNCIYSFDTIDAEDCTYMFDAIDMKDSMDVYHVGWAELMYECHAISNGYNCIGCHFAYDNRNVEYCDFTQNSKNLFGCAGMNQAEYCILNKQYSKEEYEALAAKIRDHMRKIGEYGEFFPIEFSPFAYNQTRAQEYYPLTEEEAQKKGIRWSKDIPSVPESQKIIPAEKLPEYISEVPDDILNWAILCEVTKKPFKIIKQELEFYRKFGIPIPRKHPDERYTDRVNSRKPRKLVQRECTKCRKEVESSIPPESDVKNVYCESCYLKEVY
ncbi:hypothetical protein HZA38_04505 [Candidatus Peregrinibacteria bacterium]|nr:hypothetical protein [Candidatus Peregrinibacteria bacterium]